MYMCVCVYIYIHIYLYIYKVGHVCICICMWVFIGFTLTRSPTCTHSANRSDAPSVPPPPSFRVFFLLVAPRALRGCDSWRGPRAYYTSIYLSISIYVNVCICICMYVYIRLTLTRNSTCTHSANRTDAPRFPPANFVFILLFPFSTSSATRLWFLTRLTSVLSRQTSFSGSSRRCANRYNPQIDTLTRPVSATFCYRF